MTNSLTRLLGLVFLSALPLLLPGSQPQADEGVRQKVLSDWGKAKKTFDRLMVEPSSLTAHAFYESISDRKEINTDKTEILDYIFESIDVRSPGRYRIIAIEMLNQDVYAALSAIKLLDFIDNGWQRQHSLTTLARKFVGESLGVLLRVNPAQFLRACYRESGDPYLKTKGFPVSFIPDIMNKKTTRALYELMMRKEALQSVEDAELRHIRDECLEAIGRELEIYTLDIPSYVEKEKSVYNDPKAKINYVIAEMQSKPSPENMKRVLALFSDVPSENYIDLGFAISPPYSHARLSYEIPLELILREARCGNEYAIEVLFRSLVHSGGLESMQISSALSNLILIRPNLFIEKLAKYRRLLESIDPISHPELPPYFEWTCSYISPFDYPKDCSNEILRRRIEILAALDIPEHKELIAHSIRLIEKNLKPYSKYSESRPKK